MHQGPGWSGCLADSSLRHTCSGSHRSHGLSVAAIWNHIGKSVVHPLFSLRGCLFFSGSAFLVFYLCFIPPPMFFLFSSFHCYHSLMGAWISMYVGAHGWVAGIASHGSVLLSRGWLITVEAPGHPGDPPSTQLDAVVNLNYSHKIALTLWHLQKIVFSNTSLYSAICLNYCGHWIEFFTNYPPIRVWEFDWQSCLLAKFSQLQVENHCMGYWDDLSILQVVAKCDSLLGGHSKASCTVQYYW